MCAISARVTADAGRAPSTVPNPGLTPAIRSLGPGAVQVATSLTTLFNTQMLLPMVEALDSASE